MGLLVCGCHSMSPEEFAAKCATADKLTLVNGGGICFGIRTVRPPAASTSGSNPTLLVYLHGDGRRFGPVGANLFRIAAAPPKGTISVAMVRPGYFTGDGTYSSGDDRGRYDNYTSGTIDAIAQAITTLKTFHNSPRVVLIGHSGGAAISGVIIGRHPSLADAALLISCPCDIDRWANELGYPPFKRSLSPSSYAGTVPTTTRVIALTGANDPNTFPGLADRYVADLRERGVRAEFFEISGAGHGLHAIAVSGQYDRSLQALLEQ